MPQLIIMLAAYIVAALAPFAIGIGAITYLESHRPGGEWNSNTTTAIFTAATVVSANLVGLIKTIGNGQLGKENSAKLDHLHECVENRSSEVKAEAEEAKKVASETHQEVIKAINGGLIPKEVHVTVENDGKKEKT